MIPLPDKWAEFKRTQDAMVQLRALRDPSRSAQYLARLYKARAALSKIGPKVRV